MRGTSMWLLTGLLLAAGCSRQADDAQATAPATENSKPSATKPAEDDGLVAAPPMLEAVAPQAAAEPPAKKAPRPPIYDEDADAKALIAAAVERARLEHKRVLIEWGGNWCGWCYRLHDVFHKDPLVNPIVFEEYELVLVDSKNRELMESYGGKDRQYAYPHLTILDDQGNVLTNQETGSLEEGPKHVPERVAGFLTKWQVERPNAEAVLSAALKQAGDEDKSVIVQVGTPYCGWCKVLTRFFARQQELFAKDYVRVKIDTKRMDEGDVVAKRLQPAGSLGVPWMVILNPQGELLMTSVGPEGNIGCPSSPAEIDHFLAMLKATRKRLTDDDLEVIQADLASDREERERKAASQLSKAE